MPKDNADVLGVFLPIFVRDSSVDLNDTFGGLQNTCHHFDGGGFPRSIGTDVTDDFAGFNSERNLVYCLGNLVVIGKEIAESASQTRLSIQDPKMFRQILEKNNSHCRPHDGSQRNYLPKIYGCPMIVCEVYGLRGR